MGGADQGVDLLAKAAKAHRCTCRARSGREPGAGFFFFFRSPRTLRSPESGAWTLGFLRDPHLLRRVTLGREPPKIRETRDSVLSWVGNVTSLSYLSFSISRDGRSLLEAPLGSDIL